MFQLVQGQACLRRQAGNFREVGRLKVGGSILAARRQRAERRRLEVGLRGIERPNEQSEQSHCDNDQQDRAPERACLRPSTSLGALSLSKGRQA